jgi:hypothetical protein
MTGSREAIDALAAPAAAEPREAHALLLSQWPESLVDVVYIGRTHLSMTDLGGPPAR